MTVSIFITLLTMCATITGLVVEAVKKAFGDKECSANLVAIISGCVVGIGATACYYMFSGIAFTIENVTAMILMGFASALSSMVGYDKIIQLLGQLSK